MTEGKKCVLSNCCLGEHQKHADNMKCIRDSLWRCHSSRLKVSHYVRKGRNIQILLFNIVPSTGRKVLFPSAITGKLLGRFSISLLIYIYYLQYYTLCHRTNKWSSSLYNIKQESYLRDFPHQVTSFRSLHWHHRSHESPIFITIFVSTGVDPPPKKSSECCRKRRCDT